MKFLRCLPFIPENATAEELAIHKYFEDLDIYAINVKEFVIQKNRRSINSGCQSPTLSQLF